MAFADVVMGKSRSLTNQLHDGSGCIEIAGVA